MESIKSYELTSFETISKQVDDFEQLLADYEIQIASGSDLEHGCLVLKEFLTEHHEAKRGKRIPTPPGFRNDLQLALGTLNIIQSVLSKNSHSHFNKLIPHLRLISKGSPAQTKMTSVIDQNSNKHFELRLALACMQTSTELQLDDPIKSSKGENPDIISLMSDNKKWGFACKVIHGDSPMSFFERLIEGVAQIERSDAEIGMVVISLKNKIPHSSIMPAYQEPNNGNWQLKPLKSWEEARDVMSETLTQRVDQIIEHVGRTEILNAFQGKKTLPIVSVPLESSAIIVQNQTRIATFLSYLHSVKIELNTVPTCLTSNVKKVLFEINLGLDPRRVLARQNENSNQN